MKSYGLLRLTTKERTRTMNYTIKDDNENVYVLTLGNSNKVTAIKENSQVKLNIIQDQLNLNAEAKIIDDPDEVKFIFDKMVSEKNSHFKTLNENIVILEFSIE